MKLSRIAFGLGATALVVACSTPASDEPQVSDEMREAIDTYVRIQAAEVDGGAGTTKSSGSLGGIDAVQLGSALKSGAASIPSGGAASRPTNAGNGGAGSPVIGGGGAGSPIGAGNGGVALGPVGGGDASFADAACYMIGNLCRYIARCAGGESSSGSICSVPSSCPAIVASSLSKARTSIAPQAAAIIRCFGDGLGAASCATGDLGDSLASSFGRCGISIPKATPRAQGEPNDPQDTTKR